jgi:hypothetical protein
MTPTCPHCNRGIFPTDNLGENMINTQFEIRRREKNKA